MQWKLLCPFRYMHQYGKLETRLIQNRKVSYKLLYISILLIWTKHLASQINWLKKRQDENIAVFRTCIRITLIGRSWWACLCGWG